MNKALYVPLGDGEARATITLEGCPSLVSACMEAARKAVYDEARARYGAEGAAEGREPGAPARKPCGCGDK